MFLNLLICFISYNDNQYIEEFTHNDNVIFDKRKLFIILLHLLDTTNLLISFLNFV